MLKYIVLLLLFIISNSATDFNFLFNGNYDFDSNEFEEFNYDNKKYDYYVMGGNLLGQTTVYISFNPETDDMDSYYITTKIALNINTLSTFIDQFYDMFMNSSPGKTYYITYHTDINYPFMYFAFHASYGDNIYFRFRASFSSYATSTIAAIFIVLIVLGVLVCLALASMGIAKAMGRSPLEGLMCFCILCTICCCRR